ncbi:MAG TPA: DUF58 domain-containing protein [Geminicoccaceae bacterium]|nr:DUF58 domain-containing protein [Geminicoccaceae bacterium]
MAVAGIGGAGGGPELTDRRHRAEQLAARLPPLLVAAERVAATVAQGVHGRRRVGVGETFWQFRPYQPGDSAGRIDWRQSARSVQLFLRDQEWEAAESVWLWRDGSPSMDYRSEPAGRTKLDRAIVLLLALASLLTRGGERVALLGGRGRPIGGRAGMEALCRGLVEPHARLVSLPATEPLPRYARLVLIGDFLTPIDELRARLRDYVAMGVRGHLLQVLDPAEETLPFAGRVRFEGPEDEGSTLIGNVGGVRATYTERLEAHRAALRDLARSFGWTCAVHRTDHPPEPALLALYVALAIKVGA